MLPIKLAAAKHPLKFVEVGNSFHGFFSLGNTSTILMIGPKNLRALLQSEGQPAGSQRNQLDLSELCWLRSSWSDLRSKLAQVAVLSRVSSNEMGFVSLIL